MEPSSVEDGNQFCTVEALLRDAASMEPSSVEDGNILRSTLPVGAYAWLQWSRPQLRTETRRRLSGVGLQFTASMEPSSVEDGNKAFTMCSTT